MYIYIYIYQSYDFYGESLLCISMSHFCAISLGGTKDLSQPPRSSVLTQPPSTSPGHIELRRDVASGGGLIYFVGEAFTDHGITKKNKVYSLLIDYVFLFQICGSWIMILIDGSSFCLFIPVPNQSTSKWRNRNYPPVSSNMANMAGWNMDHLWMIFRSKPPSIVESIEDFPVPCLMTPEGTIEDGDPKIC